jgi:hypothetical protein
VEIEESRASGWVAWVLFGGILLVMLGAVQLTVGFVALLRPEMVGGGRLDQLLSVPLTTIGWIHLVLGVAGLVVGVGLIRGLTWARVAAIGLALLAALVDFAFVGVYPIWSVIGIVLATLIAWAVAAHGREVADAYGR